MSVYRLGFGLSATFFATPWINKVGIGWTFGMAAIFTVSISVNLAFLIWKGPQARTWSPFKRNPDSHFGRNDLEEAQLSV